IRAEKSLYDLSAWARSRPVLAGYLMQAGASEIAAAYLVSSAPPQMTDSDSWREFCIRFTEHLNCFGHAVYDLDFAKGLATDQPLPLFETVKYFLTGQAPSPYERQSRSASAREQAANSLLSRLKGVRLRLLTPVLRWAQHYAPLREDALADVGLGW